MSQLLRWQVGAVRITRVQELEAPGMRFIVPQATLDNLAGIPWLDPFLAGNGDAMGSVHALVLERIFPPDFGEMQAISEGYLNPYFIL